MSSLPLAAKPAAPKRDAVRAMVVDDSVVVRGLIARWLEEDPGVTVVGSFRNGRQAVAEIAKADPDVVVLDVEMPEMDGLEALPLLLKAKPGVAVIMASTLTRRNAEISLKALHLGARDYVPKPETSAGVGSGDFRRDIVEKVRTLGAMVRDRRRARAPAAAPATSSVAAPRLMQPIPATSPGEARHPLKPFSNVPPRILAIGSSTGGPQALMDVLKGLGAVFPRAPIVITQHMPPTFTAILAEHLTRVSGIQAAEARDGEILTPNRIYVAPGGIHMKIGRSQEQPCALLVDGPPVNFCKPAVDPLFESVAQVYGAASLAVVLTGMGSDGAKGAGVVAQAGGSVIAQDEATSVVWGMPGATAQAGVCAAILPLPAIAQRIAQAFTGVR